MSKFGKSGKKETPGISSGSLSDIVFMLLFFFMVRLWSSFLKLQKL